MNNCSSAHREALQEKSRSLQIEPRELVQDGAGGRRLETTPAGPAAVLGRAAGGPRGPPACSLLHMQYERALLDVSHGTLIAVVRLSAPFVYQATSIVKRTPAPVPW